ncbi:MAG: hypothetical protein ACM3SW_19880, partial [Actinomycetota bacterium]
MTSKLTRAPGKELAQPSRERSLLIRGFWKALVAMAVVALVSAVHGQAGTTGTFNNSILVGQSGINQPRGMVQVSVPNGAGGFVKDWWVTDSVAGFCRLDAAGTLEAATCDINSTFELADYQAETFGVNGTNGYVFAGAIDGARRYDFTLDAQGRTAIANTVVFAGAGSLFTNNVTISGRNLPDTVNLGPDGKLYLGFVGNTDIWRVLNPLSPGFSAQGNKIERVGVTEGTGGRATSMAWIGHDLWMEDVGFINRIQNADQCFYTFPKCSAVIQFRNLFAEAGMASDQFISSMPTKPRYSLPSGPRLTVSGRFLPLMVTLFVNSEP